MEELKESGRSLPVNTTASYLEKTTRRFIQSNEARGGKSPWSLPQLAWRREEIIPACLQILGQIYFTANFSFFCVITRHEVVWNRRIRITYLSHLQGSRPTSFKMGLIGSPQTFASNHLTPRNNSEDRRTHVSRGGRLRSRTLLQSRCLRRLKFLLIMHNNSVSTLQETIKRKKSW